MTGKFVDLKQREKNRKIRENNGKVRQNDEKIHQIDHPGGRNFIPTHFTNTPPRVGIKFLPRVPITKNRKNNIFWLKMTMKYTTFLIQSW